MENCDKVNIKCGKGVYITSQLKSVVIRGYNDLNKVVPKLKKQDVIDDIIKLTGISRRSIYNILENGCGSPKKKKVFKPRYNFNIGDFDKIDNIISDFNKNKVFPSINDVFKKSKSLNENPPSFKNCARTTFINYLTRWVINLVIQIKLLDLS
jgi:hypothetical protein